MSKIKLTGSNSGYVEIDSAADAGNLTLSLPTSGTRLLSNTDNVFSGITTTAELDINGKIDVSTDIVGGRNLKVTGITTLSDDVTFTGASYDVLWDKSDNQLEFGDSAKLSFGASSDLQIFHDGSNDHILSSGTGSLLIKGDAINLGSASGEYYVRAYENGTVQIRYNNSTKIQTTNTGAVVTGICTATSFSGSGENLTRTTQLSHRNIVINGDMRIAQRATSHNSSGYRTIDRFKMTAGGASNTLTQAQVDVASGTSPYVRGFRKAFKFTNAGQNANNQGYVYMLYQIEAQDIATSGWRYMYSSGGDDYITLSFWVKASVAQNYLFFIHTSDGTVKEWSHLRSLSANSWTKVELSIPGDSGITINNDTGVGLNLYFVPYLGNHYTSGSTVDQWVNHAGYTSRPDMPSTWWTTSNSTFEVTGVQLEVGEQATPFEHRSFGEQLVRCQRYYYKIAIDPAYSDMTIGTAHQNGAYGVVTCQNPVSMRTKPSITAPTVTNGYSFYYKGTVNRSNTISLSGNATKDRIELSHTNFSATDGVAGVMRLTNGTYIEVSSEF